MDRPGQLANQLRNGTLQEVRLRHKDINIMDCHTSDGGHWFAMTDFFTRGTVQGQERAVGEIGEAPPVAGEASRFRGSAPIGGHDSGRESAGTTVGNRRPLRTWLRNDTLQEVRCKSGTAG